MPGMADVTGDTFSASLIRTAFLAQTRWSAMKSRTARKYMDLHALSASLDLFRTRGDRAVGLVPVPHGVAQLVPRHSDDPRARLGHTDRHRPA